MNQTDWGQPRPRHQYTYHPRPFPGQKGVLTYNGPLNMTAAAQGYGAYGAGYGYGMGGYGTAGYGYGGAYGTAYGGAYGVRPAYSPYTSSYISYGYGGGYYPSTYYHSGYGQGHHLHYGRYANLFYPFQSSYYGAGGAVVPYSSYGVVAAYPASTTYVATTTATAAQAAADTSTTPQVQYAYVQAAATPTKLPDAYRTVNYTTTTTRHARLATQEDVQFENRRVATERGAYRPRKIKPADAKADDVFWVRERNGDWHCRPYYQIEETCYPGTWQMDAEIGFLVFHRE